jgi:tRNA(fMet)-specific endonuclease VapC
VSFTFGAERAQRRQDQLAFIGDLLKYSTILFPDRRTTEHYGRIKAELAQIGRPIPDNDLWIAAVARQHDSPLATRDSHFAAVPRLRTLAW